MLVKVSIQFLNNDSDDKLIGTVNDILTGMTGNPNYPAPTPTLPEVTAALEEFTVAKANTAQGGRILTAIKNEKRAAMVAHATQVGDFGPFLAMPLEQLRSAFGLEWFRRRGMPGGYAETALAL